MLPAPSDNIPHATANPASHTWHDLHMSLVYLMLGSSPSAVNAGRLGYTSTSTATTDKAGRLHWLLHKSHKTKKNSTNVLGELSAFECRDAVDTYLPAFEACVTEGHAQSVMCSYNAVNGFPTCASPDLLQKQLRQEWTFPGVVVSDCGAVEGVFRNHKFAK